MTVPVLAEPPGPAVPAVTARFQITRATSLWRLGAAALAGLTTAAAFPPVGAWPLAVAGVGLFIVACRGTSTRAGFALGFVAGLTLFLPLLHWSSTYVGAPPWLLLAGSQAVFIGLLGAAQSVVSRLAGWPLWSACLWIAEEAARDRLPFGGFPWGRLAFSQAGSPLVRYAAWGGAPLVSFAVAAAGALVAFVLVEPRWQRRAVAVAGTAGVAALSAAVPLYAGGAPTATVAVVQGNVPRLGLDAFDQQWAVLNMHVQQTDSLARLAAAGRLPKPDVVIWPENASDLDPFEDNNVRDAITAATDAVGVPVLVGAVLDDGASHVKNTGVVWTPSTGPGQVYVKRHPVPFGEYIPFRSLARLVSSDVNRVPRDFVSGHRPGVLALGKIKVGDVICFEVAYDGLVRDVVTHGGQLIAVQTNNATFGHSAETWQQLAMGRLRAIEHDRAVVIAATSGVSAVISPTGHIVTQSAIFRPAVLDERIPLVSARTTADRLGETPEWALCTVALGSVCAAAGATMRRRRGRARG